ncbi:MAG: GatB/YqeY domain-containing protein [Acidobacteriaceae bacterium]
MSLVEKIGADMVAAMKAREEQKLGTLRMVKTALKNKEIDKRAPLTDAEAVQILTTLIKQRRESIEQFTKGNRPELAAKEAEEIVFIESYLPKAAGEAEIKALVDAAIAELKASGATLTPKDMGTVMKAVQAKIATTGLRADGKQVSELVKAGLAG